MIICVDFDGTCVTHEFPKTGKDIGAVPVLKKLVKHGHKLILFTMRSNKKPKDGSEQNYLGDAEKWFEKHKIPLYGINKNPTQRFWTSSPKAHGDMFIDDAALGAPTITDHKVCDRPYIDWITTDMMLEAMGLFNEKPKKE